MFWRNPTAAFFNFLLPLLFLALFGAIFGGDQDEPRRDRPGHRRHERHGDDVQRARDEHHVPARAGRAQAHARHAAADRRLPRRDRRQRGHERGAPGRARRSSPGALFFGIGWPQDWLELVVFVVAGVVCFASLGVAWSHVIPNFDAAPAYVNIVFLPVIFISGVFYDVDNAPAVPARHRPGAAADAHHRRPVAARWSTGAAWRTTSARSRDRASGRWSGRARDPRLQLGIAPGRIARLARSQSVFAPRSLPTAAGEVPARARSSGIAPNFALPGSPIGPGIGSAGAALDTPSVRPRGMTSLLYRLGQISVRHRRVVVAVWLRCSPASRSRRAASGRPQRQPDAAGHGQPEGHGPPLRALPVAGERHEPGRPHRARARRSPTRSTRSRSTTRSRRSRRTRTSASATSPLTQAGPVSGPRTSGSATSRSA